MARDLRPLYSEVTLRSSKNYHPTHTVVGVFAPDDLTITDTLTDNEDITPKGATATQRGDIWPPMTPVYYDPNNDVWRIWRGGQAIDGFLIGVDGSSTDGYHNNVSGRLKLNASGNDVQGLIMLRGDVDARDVILPPDPETAATTQVNLDGALAVLRQKGIDVYHLSTVH